jgi:hypothetical protein
MFCPSCGKENAQTSGYCNACGGALTPVPGLALTAEASPSPAPAPAAYTSPAPATAPAAYATPPRVSTPTPTARKSHSALLVVVAIIAAALVGGLGWGLSHKDQIASFFNSETPEQRIGRLMREAAGAQPVRNSLFPSSRQFDDAFREQFRNIFRVNQEFMSRIKQLDMGEIGKVGTPQSFADPQYAAEGIRQVHASYELDNELEQRVGEIASNIRQTFQNTSWSVAERGAALRGFDRGFADALEKRKPLINAERAYVETTDDIYNYATDHHADIQLVNGKLLINDPLVVQNFNAKIGRYNVCRGDLLRAKENFDRFQRDMFNKMGMSPKDVGLQ